MFTLDDMLVSLPQAIRNANQFLGDITEQEISSVNYPTKYAYVNNSPLSFTDPSGFTPWQFEFEGIDISVTIRFGKSKRGRAARVVKGCFVLLADSCYGKASGGIFDVSSDVFGPGYGGYGNYNDYILNTWTTGEVAHEGAIIFWPGYDLGTCIYEGGCSWLDWGFGIIGVIPGGKVATTSAKGLVKGADKLDDLADLRRVSKTCCFVAGTLVDTENGLVPIEEIHVGDRVWARDVDSGETALKEVTDLIRRHERQIWTVSLESDDGTIQRFETTDDHPWWIPELGWVNTHDLNQGMVATSRAGKSLIVNEVAETDKFAATFNLTVADFETYFVGERRVLVHNCDISDGLKKAEEARDEALEELSELSNTQRSEVSTVVGAHDPATGNVAVGMKKSGCDAGKCAEDLAADALGNPDPKSIEFTEVIRPRTGEVVPRCERCTITYGSE